MKRFSILSNPSILRYKSLKSKTENLVEWYKVTKGSITRYVRNINTSLVAPGPLAYCFQHRKDCKIHNGHRRYSKMSDTKLRTTFAR